MGLEFRNPVLLAAGTCGFGEELHEVLPLESLGGIVTKSVTLEPRGGNPAPRVAEFGGGMINSVGLANPGARAVVKEKLPWLAANLREARVLVSVAGHTPDEYVRVVEILDAGDGFQGYEINLSCPNDTRRGGLPFALDPESIPLVVSAVRAVTQRPFSVKLAPNTPDIAAMAALAVEAGADAVTLVNTIPGLVLDPIGGTPRLGAGPGGVSGPALLAVGVHATSRVRARLEAPILGVGGVSTAGDALQYLRAGADLVQVGTQSFADPRASLRVLDGLRRVASRGRLPEPRPGRWRPVAVEGASPAGSPTGPRPPAAAPDHVGVHLSPLGPSRGEAPNG
jgi:dihydroorotate dehydrogenase (NAD+) catalytic subunit